MKKILYIFLSVFLVLSCEENKETEKTIKPVQTENSDNAMNQQVFVSEWFPVSVSFPKGWEAVEDTTLSMIYIMTPTDESDNFQEMVNIVVGGTNGKELDAFFDGNLKMIQGMFEELNQTEQPSYQIINGVKFKKVRYNYLIEGLPLTAQLYVTIKDDLSYIINCSALQNTFDEFEEGFSSIVSSFSISQL